MYDADDDYNVSDDDDGNNDDDGDNETWTSGHEGSSITRVKAFTFHLMNESQL